MLPAPGPQVPRYEALGAHGSLRAARAPAPRSLGRRRALSRLGWRARPPPSRRIARRGRRRSHPHQHGGAAGGGAGGRAAAEAARAALPRQHARPAQAGLRRAGRRLDPRAPTPSTASRARPPSCSAGAATATRSRSSTTRSTWRRSARRDRLRRGPRRAGRRRPASRSSEPSGGSTRARIWRPSCAPPRSSRRQAPDGPLRGGRRRRGGGREELPGTASTQLVRELGLDGRLTFAGARRDIPAVMRALDLFVLTSRHEGFGRVVAEAMAAARPVVVTDEGALPELVGGGDGGPLRGARRRRGVRAPDPPPARRSPRARRRSARGRPRRRASSTPTPSPIGSGRGTRPWSPGAERVSDDERCAQRSSAVSANSLRPMSSPPRWRSMSALIAPASNPSSETSGPRGSWARRASVAGSRNQRSTGISKPRFGRLARRKPQPRLQQLAHQALVAQRSDLVRPRQPQPELDQTPASGTGPAPPGCAPSTACRPS